MKTIIEVVCLILLIISHPTVALLAGVRYVQVSTLPEAAEDLVQSMEVGACCDGTSE
jgi:hypothetical protein